MRERRHDELVLTVVSSWVLPAAAGLLGLVVGSFLNVVAWRVPRGESVVRPASHCPACGSPVRPRDNVPVLSWLLLHGRCRDCHRGISVRYPLVEALTGVLFAVVATSVGDDAALPAFLYLTAAGVVLSLIDLDVRRLPDVIVLPSYVVMAALLAVAAAVDGSWSSLLRALAGGVALFAVYLLLVLLYPAGMGLGDLKLAGVLGTALGWLGWGPLVVGGFGAFLLGGAAGVVLLASGRATRKSGVPFGPFMLSAALLAVLAGSPIASGYLHLVGI